MRRTAAACALLLMLSGCAHPPAEPVTTRFTESGVEVTIVVSTTLVKATFRPTRPGFHIYSVDLPPGGINGLGIPTRLRVRAGLVATGRAGADQPVRTMHLPALAVSLPVYPDGPVTVSLPVRRTTGRTAQILVSYGACSAGTCLAPVIDHLTRVDLR